MLIVCAVVDASGHNIRGRSDIAGKIEMDAGERLADLFGLRDQILALTRQIFDDAADAHFIVEIGRA